MIHYFRHHQAPTTTTRTIIMRNIFSPRNRRTLQAGTLLLLSTSSSSTSPTSTLVSARSDGKTPAFLHSYHHNRAGATSVTDTSRRHISSFSSLLFSSSSSSSSSSPPQPAPLDSIHDLAKQLSNGNYRNILVLVGAGASVNAGIPDFRTPGTGLYDQLHDYYDLPYPEAIFDLEYFKHSPQAFCQLAQSIWPNAHRPKSSPKPTKTHAFLKLLSDAGGLRRVYTQNIDGLESIAGLDDDVLVECHGHFRSASCIQCGTAMDANQCRDIILMKKKKNDGDDDDDDNNNNIPTCSKCGSYVKPDIVFFGEELPLRFQQLLDYDTQACDLLLIVGTSLLVMPVAGIPNWVSKEYCPRVLINKDLVGDFVHTYHQSRTSNDLVLQGDCDESIQQLCKLMPGWESKLEETYRELQKPKQQQQ